MPINQFYSKKHYERLQGNPDLPGQRDWRLANNKAREELRGYLDEVLKTVATSTPEQIRAGLDEYNKKVSELTDKYLKGTEQ